MKPYAILFIGAVAVSFASIFIRLAAAPPLVIATYRMVIASLVLLPVASAKSLKRVRTLSVKDVSLIVLASVFLAVHFALWITSLSYTSIASSVILVTVHPVFVALISYFLWKERLTGMQLIGIILTLCGAVLINYGSFTLSSEALLGDMLALFAGLMVGGYLIIGRHLRTRIDITGYLALNYSGAAVFLLIATLTAGKPLFGYSGMTYLWLVLVALVPQLIGHSSFNLALRLLPATFVSIAILGEPVGATLLGYIILNEVPTLNELIGGTIVIIGIFTVLRQAPQTASVQQI